MTRALLALASLVALASCTPVFNLSFYNASGMNLTVNGQNDEIVDWPSKTYLTFNNRGSNMVGMDYPEIYFRIFSSDGRNLVYSVDKTSTEGFTYVTSGALNAEQATASVTPEPSRACVHVRMEADLKLYWVDSGCGRRDLANSQPSEQPEGFPVVPVSQ